MRVRSAPSSVIEEAQMVRYFFHLRVGHETIADPEGTDLPDARAARRAAEHAARELAANAVRFGESDVPDMVVVADETGKILDTVRLKDILPAALRS
jgi:hypothetical protein